MPKPALKSFDSNLGIPSAQISKIIEAFDWEELPPGINLAFRKDRMISVCFIVSFDAERRLRTYCDRESKNLNYAVIQALISLGKYTLPTVE
jgi:hypothetical protein